MTSEVKIPQLAGNASPLDAIIADSTSSGFVAIVLPFIILTAFVVALTHWSAASHRRLGRASRGVYYSTPSPLLTAAIVIGMGIGGLIDGIVFHQVLQWHTMLSNKLSNYVLENIALNTFWEAILFAYTLTLVITGIIMLWKTVNRPEALQSANLFAAGLLIGWGLFNLVEGVIDHHIFKLHNVFATSGSPALWNDLFLGFSLALIAIGLLLLRFVQRKVFIKSWK
jgi:uncharacterized membrane protein